MSLEDSREACAPAQEDARDANLRREATEERELQASNTALERQIQARKAALAASLSKAPFNEKEG